MVTCVCQILKLYIMYLKIFHYVSVAIPFEHILLENIFRESDLGSIKTNWKILISNSFTHLERNLDQIDIKIMI